MGSAPQRFPEALQALQAVPGLELHVHDYFMELPMLARLFARLQADPRFGDFEWLVFSRQHPTAELQRPLHPQRTVLIYIGNEDGFLPPWISEVYRVFSPDCAQWPLPPHLHMIPLGAHGATPELPVLPFAERHLDLFFAGQVLKQRSGFLLQAIELLYTLKAYPQYRAELHLTPHFQQGLSPEHFAQRLSQTRIALVPPGHSPITLRLFEALRAGCVLFTGKLPPFDYLKDLPRIEFDSSWQGLVPAALEHLQAPEALHQAHLRSLRYYQQVCAPEAVAALILRQL